MQSTGQTSTHAVSLVPIQGSAITYAIVTLLRRVSGAQIIPKNASPTQIEKIGFIPPNEVLHKPLFLSKIIARPDHATSNPSRSEFESGDRASYNTAQPPGNCENRGINAPNRRQQNHLAGTRHPSNHDLERQHRLG